MRGCASGTGFMKPYIRFRYEDDKETVIAPIIVLHELHIQRHYR